MRHIKLFHTKAKMLTPDEVTALVGHAVGGVCPFGVKAGVSVYLDESLRRFETVFPACGSSNSAIELTIAELERYSGYRGVDRCVQRLERGSGAAAGITDRFRFASGTGKAAGGF